MLGLVGGRFLPLEGQAVRGGPAGPGPLRPGGRDLLQRVGAQARERLPHAPETHTDRQTHRHRHREIGTTQTQTDTDRADRVPV